MRSGDENDRRGGKGREGKRLREESNERGGGGVR